MPAPAATNEVWSIDFFDRTAVARVLKRLTVVDDATHVSRLWCADSTS